MSRNDEGGERSESPRETAIAKTWVARNGFAGNRDESAGAFQATGDVTRLTNHLIGAARVNADSFGITWGLHWLP